MSNILLVTFHMFYQVVRSYQKREQIKVGSKLGESTSYRSRSVTGVLELE